MHTPNVYNLKEGTTRYKGDDVISQMVGRDGEVVGTVKLLEMI